MAHRYQPAAPLAGEMIEAFAGQSVSGREFGDGFLAFMDMLHRSPESAAGFSQLTQLARLAGRQERRAEEARAYRVATVILVAGILAITLILGGLFAAPGQTEQAAINDVYQRMSPAVADIRVESAGITGSGVVFDRDGFVLTNYHVISEAQNDEDIAVNLPGLMQVPAHLIGYDVATDLAVLKVDVPPERLTVAEFGNSEVVTVGDLAIAIGSPFGLSRTLTVGHISAAQRRLMSNDMYAPDVEGVLQTDAAINPGNSGGPLFDSRGQVIGINTRIGSPSGGSVGIGFAIASNTAGEIAYGIIERENARRSLMAEP